MTASEILKNAPSLDVLDAAISMKTLQLALLQQQYAPNHLLFMKIPHRNEQARESVGKFPNNLDFESDKVTIGDAVSVYPHLCVVGRVKR